MMRIVQRLRIPVLAMLCMAILSSCGGSSSDVQTGSGGVTVNIQAILRGFADAGTVVSASVRTLWSDAQKRAANIAEGTEKIKEGKEQVERGVRGE
ncbi:hypothetical protein A3C37_01500 [Candidatus Peribacteria bacterium RIFCSPHIGHO2_02_FULL_53_20]|nr:MAG: hypothetical protein A3C37_01500 [Candidatus Peribacteria bacterium RIFCSPHIGHO2_02_FULL_53_20]OGJ67206.1 MAG: hypothetical protein A3B61_01880 [Candidatus Peribacteria bacterium RIFCSPLOWO2_01_FULL_53_10]OGJ69367.1 MAG: hypothetical protein A3G69_00870 [Candidatus Peribacteria bacterium RIFCSPLOWO2_12_FULL_53_10]